MKCSGKMYCKHKEDADCRSQPLSFYSAVLTSCSKESWQKLSLRHVWAGGLIFNVISSNLCLLELTGFIFVHNNNEIPAGKVNSACCRSGKQSLLVSATQPRVTRPQPTKSYSFSVQMDVFQEGGRFKSERIIRKRNRTKGHAKEKPRRPSMA